jgi:uncharacterized protein YjbI with pentapeptide repeats
MRVPTWAVAAFVTVFVFEIIIDGYIRGRWAWEGSGFSGASLWDWLDLLIVPLMLGIGGIWFQRAQRTREVEMENRQRQRELEIEDQRAQDAALQAYLDQMGVLLVERDLLEALHGPSTLARAYTLTILERLDPDRKRIVVRFLYEAGLLTRRTELTLRVVRLEEANLRYAALANMYLAGINLTGADLKEADLSNTRLAALEEIQPPGTTPGNVKVSHSEEDHFANLRPLEYSLLDSANLTGALLRDTYLPHCSCNKDTKLKGADLRGADLRGIKNLTDDHIREAIGDETTKLPDRLQRPAHWSTGDEEESKKS